MSKRRAWNSADARIDELHGFCGQKMRLIALCKNIRVSMTGDIMITFFFVLPMIFA